jgi:hypothetical protein
MFVLIDTLWRQRTFRETPDKEVKMRKELSLIKTRETSFPLDTPEPTRGGTTTD